MPHKLALKGSADGSARLVCEDRDHDWETGVSDPSQLVHAVTEHNEAVRREAKQGLYVQASTRGYQPIVFRRDHQGRWWQTTHWQEATHPDVPALQYVGPFDEEA